MKYINEHKQVITCLLIVGIFLISFIALNNGKSNITSQNEKQSSDTLVQYKAQSENTTAKDTSKLEQLLKEEENIKERENLSQEFIQTHPGETLWNYLFVEKEYYNQFEFVKSPELISNEEIHYTIRGRNAAGVNEVREIHLVLKEQKWEIVLDKVVE
jgi:hypothetical protein